MKYKRGFTLVELIAVLAILAVVLSITVPTISNLIGDATRSAFKSDATIVLQAIEQEQLRNEKFDITQINKNTFTQLLGMSSKEYQSITVSIVNNRAYVVIVGTDKWEGLTAYGNFDGITVISSNDYIADTEVPVITLIGNAVISIGIGDNYVDQGATAIDNIDGDITSSIITSNPVNSNVAGTYIITYNVKDSAGNAAVQVIRTVNVKDAIAPIITLNGNNPLTIAQGSVYSDPGATASDNIDGDISSNILVTGTVNPNLTGTYEIIYNVSDSSGNEATATRTVNVIDNTAPIITFSINGNTTYAKSRSTSVTVSDEHSGVDANSLKYIWNTNMTVPSEESFATTFTNGSLISTPLSATGGYYLWILAKDTQGNTKIDRTDVFNLDNTIPSLSVTGSNPTVHSVGNVYSDLGAIAIDNIDGNITANIISTGTVNTSVVGTYTITYTVSDSSGNMATVQRTVNVMQTLFAFDFTGNSQTWTVPTAGTYKLEIWGAQGGEGVAGSGGYSVGEKVLSQGTQLYIYVGGMNGFNGGRSGAYYTKMNSGGASDIRLGGAALGNRIIVAGGGGGAGGIGPTGAGSYGGGSQGINGYPSGTRGGYGGTQTAGGAGGLPALDGTSGSGNQGSAGTLGTGGAGGTSHHASTYGGHGGGGYYGGGGGGGAMNNSSGSGSGGGGSGYIGGVTNGQTLAGNAIMPNPSGGTMTGKAGNGFVKITYIGS